MATNCDPIHDGSSNFHANIATQLYKIISDSVTSNWPIIFILNKLNLNNNIKSSGGLIFGLTLKEIILFRF